MRPLLLALALTVACGRSEPPSESSPPTAPAPTASASAPPPGPRLPDDLNVLLITIDALRADMPWTGYARDIAPHLTGLAKRGVVYTRGYALSSYTAMSAGGLLAGRYPSEIPRDGFLFSRFYDEAVMVPELLQQAGIGTAAFHAHVYFAGASGLKQGFDEWTLVPKVQRYIAREGAITDELLANLVIEGLERRAERHPRQRFFAWVHFMDPHFSYAPHPEFRFEGSVPPVPPGVELSKIGQHLRNRYDAEVAWTDAQVGRVLDHLRSTEWGRKTAVVVTSDHGEAFGEHPSFFEHGNFLHEVVLRVPVLVFVPGLPPRRIEARRSHIDLAPTILGLFGLDAPEPMRGTSWVPELLGAKAEARPIIADVPYTNAHPRRRMLIEGDWKITETETQPRPTLFDLSTDPTERQNLADTRKDDLKRMQARLADANRRIPDFPAPRRKRGAVP